MQKDALGFFILLFFKNKPHEWGIAVNLAQNHDRNLRSSVQCVVNYFVLNLPLEPLFEVFWHC